MSHSSFNKNDIKKKQQMQNNQPQTTVDNPFKADQKANKKEKKEKNKDKNKDYFKQSNKSIFSSKAAIVVYALIIIISLALLVEYSYDIERFFDDIAQSIYLSNMEIVEDYTFDIADTNDEFDYDPFPLELSSGTAMTIDQTNERFVINDGELVAEFVVGVDIDPGVYTVNANGSVEVDFDTDVRYSNYIYNRESFSSTTHYNIPLIPGDQIEIAVDNLVEEFSVDLVPQTEYQQFEYGNTGIYVYGLSNFNPEINFESEDYDELKYCYQDKEGYGLDCDYINDQDITLNGSPGSYFIVSYDD